MAMLILHYRLTGIKQSSGRLSFLICLLAMRLVSLSLFSFSLYTTWPIHHCSPKKKKINNSTSSFHTSWYHPMSKRHFLKATSFDLFNEMIMTKVCNYPNEPFQVIDHGYIHPLGFVKVLAQLSTTGEISNEAFQGNHCHGWDWYKHLIYVCFYI